MGCEYCLTNPCASGCPNAEIPKLNMECYECEYEFEVDDRILDIDGDYYCEECVFSKTKDGWDYIEG